MEASVYDAIYTSVAEREGVPVEEVEQALARRDMTDDYFWDAWDRTVSDAAWLFRRVTGRPDPKDEDY